MPELTLREWLFIAGVYLMASAVMSLILGFIRGWRGPSNRDLQKAVVTVTRWINKTNMGDKPTQIRSLTIWQTGQVDSHVNRNPLATPPPKKAS